MRMKRSDGVETRQKLLEAASNIFADRGYHDATVAAICKMAKANIAAVNYYFGSKEELYAEAWRYTFELTHEKHPHDDGVPATAPAEERLRGAVRSLMKRILDPDSRNFDIVHKEIANPTGLLHQVMTESIEPLRKNFQSLVKELLGDGATEEMVMLCEWSVHSMCLGVMFCREPKYPNSKANIKNMPKVGCPKTREVFLSMGVDALVDHVMLFSLAGIKEFRKQLAGAVS